MEALVHALTPFDVSDRRDGTSKPAATHVGHYEVLKTIGEGSFAKVKLGVHRLTHAKVALKVIDKRKVTDDYALEHMHREAHIMSKLDHPHIIRLYEIIETPREMVLVMEYAPKGELLDYIVRKERLAEDDAREFVRNIVSALEHCHKKNIVHRDLKAENILLGEGKCVKLSDFGLGNYFDYSKTLDTACGSPVYSPPELISGKSYVGPEVDAWSLGVNMYAMVVGDLPFADNNVTSLYESIMNCEYELPDFLSDDCKDLITKLLNVNPRKRYTVSQAREHPWLKLNEQEKLQAPAEHYILPSEPEDIVDAYADHMEHKLGFNREEMTKALLKGDPNSITATYYLIAQQILAGKTLKDLPDLNTSAPSLPPLTRTTSRKRAKDKEKASIPMILMKAEDDGQSGAPSTATVTSTMDKKDKSPSGSRISADAIRRRRLVENFILSTPQETIMNTAEQGALQTGQPENASNAQDTTGNTKVPTSTYSRRRFSARHLPPVTRGRVHSIGATPITPRTGPITSSSIPPGTARKFRGRSRSFFESRTHHMHHATKQHQTEPESTSVSRPSSSEPPSDEAGPVGEIRTARFAFNCSTTSSRPPEEIWQVIKDTLDENNILYTVKAYSFECRYLGGAAHADRRTEDSAGADEVRFELEICKLPRLVLYGIQVKRLSGDIWEYKRLVHTLVSKFEL